MEVQADDVDDRLTRTKQASEETGSTGSVRREARDERISRQDNAEAPSGDADKPRTWAICRNRDKRIPKDFRVRLNIRTRTSLQDMQRILAHKQKLIELADEKRNRKENLLQGQ